MKKLILTIFTLGLTLSLVLTGCGGSNNKTEIKTSDGQLTVGDNVKWPQDNMGDLQAPNAKIVGVVKDTSSQVCVVAFSEMKQDEAAKYLVKLKELGYKSVLEVNDNDGIMFSGKNANDAMVTFAYNITAMEGSVTYSINPTESKNINPQSSQVSIDMSDVSPWPKNFISGVPELNGKIVNVSNSNDESVTIDLEYVEKTDFETFVKTLKQNGYTVEANEEKDSYSYEYKAYNENGDWIDAYMKYENKTAMIDMEKAK